MNSWKPNRRTAGVLLASLILVVLSATLVSRVAALGGEAHPGAEQAVRPSADPGPAPEALVPAPRRLSLEQLGVPKCWSCPAIPAMTPLDFQVDLDLLAPLGDGAGNAALWLRQFSKQDGHRGGWSDERVKRKVRGRLWSVLPPGHPVLLEAEPWMDQALCRFYPDVWEVDGMDTPLPNLLLALTLARSWVVRGLDAEDPEAARQDFRRAVRLGRLLRQENLVAITDLVGLACIRFGAEALYDAARRDGDAPDMLAAARALADGDALRLLASSRLGTITRVTSSVRRGWLGPSLEAGDDAVDALTILARGGDRRYRFEAIHALQLVRHLGTGEQAEQAASVLEEMTASGDAILARDARRALQEEPDLSTVVE